MRAVAKDEPGEPDPQHFERFCHAIVLETLTDVCHVGTELATQVGDDILARGESYAALDDAARNVLISPFAEEVAGYDPAASPLELKGAVAVIVRSSLLEEAHTHGPVEAGGIRGITTVAAAPLSHFLAARRRYPVPVTGNQFTGLADAYPRAWACLGGVALAYGAGGGRWPYRAPAAPVPDLPAAEVEAPSASSREDAVVLSGIDTRFDQLLVEQMRERAEGGEDAVLLIASLSRISRHLGKLMRAMEYLLAHDVPILTANYLLRPREVWVRRGDLAPVDHRDSGEGRETDGGRCAGRRGPTPHITGSSEASSGQGRTADLPLNRRPVIAGDPRVPEMLSARLICMRASMG